MKKPIKIIVVTALVLCALYLIFRVIVTVQSKPLLIDSLSITVNGRAQHLTIMGKDSSNPIVLYVHGGPGLPESPLFMKFNRKLLDSCTIVFWDQYGSGLSYSKECKSISLKDIVEDAQAVSIYLKDRFKKKKITLLAHSWGTIVGLNAVNARPDLYNSYIGISQKSSVAKSERILFNTVLRKAQSPLREKLISIMNPDSSYEYTNAKDRMMVRKAVMANGGAIYNESSYFPYLVPYLYSYEYGTPLKMVQLVNGMLFSVKYLLDDMNSSDLFTLTDSLAVPFYIFQGQDDLQTPHSEAKRLFDSIKAPTKQFFSIEEAAHNPHFEKSEQFNREFIGIINSLQVKNNKTTEPTNH